MKNIKIVIIACILIIVASCKSTNDDVYFKEINANKGSVILKMEVSNSYYNYTRLYIKDSTGKYKTIKVYKSVAKLFKEGNKL